MTRKENRNDPRSPAELRASFIELTHDIEAVEHIGRHNRLFGRRRKIAEQLMGAGGNPDGEPLPLLEDPSLAVRWRRPCRPPLRPQRIRRVSEVMGTRRSTRAC